MTEHDRGRTRRAEVLRVIRDARSGLGVAEIAERLGAPPSTVRFHLGLLVDDGAVEQAVDAPTGPGRPRVVYRAQPVMALGSDRRYQMLAEVLLSGFSSGRSGSERTAIELGRTWGALSVVDSADQPSGTAREAVDRLLAVLEDMGFAPRPAPAGRKLPTEIRLRHCPFFELAERHRDVVCPLHLGLMRGMLEALEAPVGVADLVPFADPHACVAHLTPA